MLGKGVGGYKLSLDMRALYINGIFLLFFFLVCQVSSKQMIILVGRTFNHYNVHTKQLHRKWGRLGENERPVLDLALVPSHDSLFFYSCSCSSTSS